MEFRPNQLVAALFVIGTIVILLYETWAIGWRGEEWTITAVLTEWSREFPILPLVIGILMGHLFFCHPYVRMDKQKESVVEKRPEEQGSPLK